MGPRLAWATFAIGAVVCSARDADAQSPPTAPETIAVGDWLLAPTLQLRTRGELWQDPVDVGGGADPNTGRFLGPRVRIAGGAFERSRLGVGADKGALHAQLTLQDTHAWGVMAPSGALGLPASTLAQFGAYEAYVEAHTAAANANYLRIGRQAVTWGEGRLLGASDWSPVGRSLDAARAHLGLGNFDFELLAALLATTRPLGAGFSDQVGPQSGGSQLFGAQIAWTIDPLLKLQLFGLARYARGGSVLTPTEPSRSFAAAADTGQLYTGAARVSGDSKGWRYGLEGAYQFGHASNLGLDRAAYAFAGHVGYKFDRVALTPTIRLGGSFASGDDGGSTYKQFDPILPDVHAYLGAMDIFSWSNIEEANARVTVVPWTDTTFAVEYRYAQLQQASGEWVNGYLQRVGGGTPNMAGAWPANTSAQLGHEIDAAFTWLPWTAVELVFGYSAFLFGDGAKAILLEEGRAGFPPDGSPLATASVSHYAYLQATLRAP